MILASGFFSFANISVAMGESGAWKNNKFLSGLLSTYATNSISNGGFFYVGNNSSFEMSSGSLSGASATNGGAIYVASGGSFNFKDGTISGNKATNGGAVGVASGGTFNMSGGTISGNNATNGNQIYNDGTFSMTGGTIGSFSAYTIVDINGNIDASGNYVLFGSYPQSKKAEGVSVNESDMNKNGQMYGSDGNYYQKMGTEFYKVEPILWQIVEETDGKALLIPINILETHRFDESSKDYSQSEIRTWLNSSFYNLSFSAKERAIIQKTNIELGSTLLSDNISLVNRRNLINFSYSKAGTDYSVDNGLILSPSGNGQWWILNSGNKSFTAVDPGSGDSSAGNVAMVEPGGTIGMVPSPNMSSVGVVPMVTISFSRENVSSGNGIYNSGTMNLLGGTIYDDIYTSTTLNINLVANYYGRFLLGETGTLYINDYFGRTPDYAISVSASRKAGTLITFADDDTEPDIFELKITGYDQNLYKLKTQKDAKGNWTVVLYSYAMNFPTNWKTEVASNDYMSSTVTPSNLTSIKFVSSVPTGYTKIGTLSTGIPVYKGSTINDIAFVAEKIYAPENCEQLFYNLTKLTSIEFDVFETSKVTSMVYMVGSCSSLTNLDVSNFDTSKITNMRGMFIGCSSLTSLDLSNFDTSKVTNMMYVFQSCKGLISLDLSTFDTSKVTSMNQMFFGCSGLTSLNVSNFNTSNVTNMNQMFYNCSSLTSLDLSNFITSNVTTMYRMFSSCRVLTSLDMSNFDTSNVTDMGEMFYGCNSLTSLDLSTFDTSKVTSMNQMFLDCSSLTSLDLSNFDTSNTTDMGGMFSNCKGLTSLDLSNFNTSKVIGMSGMFSNCSGLTSIDVSNFDTSKVISMGRMFSRCTGLTSLDLSTFNTKSLTNLKSAGSSGVDGETFWHGIFDGSNNLEYVDLSNWSNDNLTSFNGIFSGMKNLKRINLTNFKTPKAVEMNYMFYGCESLTEIDLSSFDTSKATNFNAMFYKCKKLTNLNLSNFDTSNVTRMASMFRGCTGLTSLDISNFNTANVTRMRDMFENCTNLTSLDLSSFDTSNVTNMSSMFYNCSGLKTLDISSFNMSKVTSFSSMLNFGSTNKIELLKTPYGNTSALSITTGSTLYNDETGEVVTSVSANTAKSLTYSNKAPFKEFSKTWKEEISSTEYMTTTIVPETIANIMFVSSAPAGYSKIGTLSTGIDVYHKRVSNVVSEPVASMNYIAFVADSICAPVDCSMLFADIQLRNGIDFSNFDTSKVTSMKGMFLGCSAFTSLDLGGFNTSKVTDMSGMFFNCRLLTSLDLSGFDTSKVTDMTDMFYSCTNLTSLNVSSFNTSQVTGMGEMFYQCWALTSLDVSNFNTSKVTNMSGMFYKCRSLTGLDLGKFDTINVTDMSIMFSGCSELPSLDLSKFDTSNVTDMSSMFSGCSELPSLDLSGFNMAKVTNVTSMLDFGSASKIEMLKTPYGNTIQIPFSTDFVLYDEDGTSFSAIPAGTKTSFELTKSLPKGFFPTTWKRELSSAEYMTTTISSNSLNLKFLFSAPAGYSKIGTLSTGIEVYKGATENDIAFVSGKIYAPTDCSNLFSEYIVSADFSNFDTSKTVSMFNMFDECYSLTSLDLSGFNTSKVTNMRGMFSDCISLSVLDLTSFDTSNVTDMSSMFYSCRRMAYLDLSSFNMSKVTQADNMFNFGGMSSIYMLKGPYGNTMELPVSNIESLYDEEGNMVNAIPAGKTRSVIYECVPAWAYLPETWKEEIGSSKYMEKTISASSLSTIKFLRRVPEGYSKIGMLSTGLPVYRGSTVYDIAFIGKTIFAPSDCTRLFFEKSSMGNRNLSKIDFTSFNTSYVTNMSEMFYGGTALTSIDISNFNTSNVTDMSCMFFACIKLTSLNLSNFNTSKVTNMSCMFQDCAGLTSLDLSKFDTTNVTDMSYMFLGCSGLTSLDLGNFVTTNVTDMSYMFSDCSSLTSLDVSSFDMSNVSNSAKMFNFGSSNAIQTIKTPFSNTSEIAITTGSTLYNELGNVVSSVPSGTSTSLTYSNEKKSDKIKITFQLEGRATFSSGGGIIALYDKDGNVIVNFSSPTQFYYNLEDASRSYIGFRQVGNTIEVEKGTTWFDILSAYGLVCSDTNKVLPTGFVTGSVWTTEQLKSIGSYWNQSEDNPTFNEDTTLIFYSRHSCLASDTEIDVYDEKRKRKVRKKLKDISYKDKILVWNFDKGCFDFALPLFITKPQTTTRYTMVVLSDGSSLRLVGADDTRRHRLFCFETGKFEYVGNGIKEGMTTYNDKGEQVKIVKIEFINDKIEFMNIITNEHFNCFANGVLTGCKLSNMYPIKNMKFDKSNKTLNSREMFADVSDFYFKALRLSEQPLLNTYNGHSELIDYKQIYEIEWERASFARDEK